MLKRLLVLFALLFAAPALAAGPIWVDRVQDTSTTTGTADFVLSGTPPTGLQAWSTVGNTNTAQYIAADSAGDWEQGLGTYSSTGPTLARTTVLASSNSGAKVSFPAGTKTISLTPDASWFTGPLPEANGGTGANLSATGGAHQVLQQASSGAAVTVGQLAASDLSNGTNGSGAVCLTTSCSMTTPALGTPSAGVATNLTGTATGLTAGTATAANGIKSATTTVTCSAATAPTSGEVLTATSTTACDWETPSGGPSFVRKTSTQTRSSSTTLTNDTDLKFSVAANTDYVFQFNLIVFGGGASALAGGAKVAVTAPASPTLVTYSVAFGADGGTPVAPSGGGTQTAGTGVGAALASSTNGYVTVTGTLVNGANAGTLQLQIAQNSSSSSGTSFEAGSWGMMSVVN